MRSGGEHSVVFVITVPVDLSIYCASSTMKSLNRRCRPSTFACCWISLPPMDNVRRSFRARDDDSKYHCTCRRDVCDWKVVMFLCE